MWSRALCVIVIVGLAFSGLSYAQRGPGQPLISPGMQHNMGTIAGMMKEIHLLLHQHLTPKQNEQISEMMIRLGAMMKEMSGPQGEQMARRHEQELKEMRRLVGTIEKQLEQH